MAAPARRNLANPVRYFRFTLALLLGPPLLLTTSPGLGQAAPPYHVPGDFSTIGAALNSSATTGQTILVAPGTYRYTSTISVSNKDATNLSSPTILMADGGQVIIDCADYFGDSTWTQHSGNVYRATRLASIMTPPTIDGQNFATEVFVDSVRYTFVNDTTYTTLPAGSWAFDAAAQRVYVHLIGGGSPADSQIYIGDNRRKQGLHIQKSDLFVIDVITIRHASGAGILIEGDTTTGVHKDRLVTVKNCTISQCFKQGVQLSRTVSSYIQNNDTHSNGDHGIQLIFSDSCSITGNTSYLNDDPLNVRGGQNGIRIGNGADSTRVSDINVDYNVIYSNEDSGIESNGARRVVVRRNVIYGNRDHGVDNLVTSRTAYINNVIFGNDHDGVSVESNARGVWVLNNILMHNARNVSTLQDTLADVSELDVLDTTSFVSNYNVINPLPGTDIPGHGDSHDRHVVDLPGAGTTYFDTFKGYQLTTGFDAASDSTMPAFSDTSHSNFTLSSGTTYAVDAAKSNISGWRSPMWLSIDPAGAAPHNADKTDLGVGSPTYGDIGAFEYDPLPGAPTVTVLAGRFNFVVLWNERGDDGDLVTAGTHELYIDGSGRGAVAASPPGTPICVEVDGWSDCTPFDVQVKITEADNGKVVWSNLINTNTDCSGNQAYACGENGLAASRGSEASSTFSLEGEDVDYPLSVAVAGPNPSRSFVGVVYGIPKAMAGKPFELSMFDVSGRRVAEFGRGTARPGRRLEPLPSGGSGQTRLAPGVYYLRLVVADKTLTKTVLLVP